MICKQCGIEFKKKFNYQRYCTVECRIKYNTNTNYIYSIRKYEKLCSEEFKTLNYRDDPVLTEPHVDFHRSCQLQTVIKTGLYIPYKNFDDQDFIGVKNLKFCVGCIWSTHCKKDRENKFYPAGCKSYLKETDSGYQKKNEETLQVLE